MVGILQGVLGNLFVFIQDVVGGIYRVCVGNYMGQNYGCVIGVNEMWIELIEIVFNGWGGWVECLCFLILDEEEG